MMTKEEMDEYATCSNSIQYFAEKHIKINTPDGFSTIVLNDFQRAVTNIFANTDLSFVNPTGRQQGKTTIALIIILHYVLFNPHKTVVINGWNTVQAHRMLHVLMDMYRDLPAFLKPEINNQIQDMVQFDNGCRIIASSSASRMTRGMTINLRYIDEIEWCKYNREDYIPHFSRIFALTSINSAEQLGLKVV